jgi:hypothetical protein
VIEYIEVKSLKKCCPGEGINGKVKGEEETGYSWHAVNPAFLLCFQTVGGTGSSEGTMFP